MSTVGAFVSDMAGSMDLWRDSAVAVLAGVVIACLLFYAEITQP